MRRLTVKLVDLQESKDDGGRQKFSKGIYENNPGLGQATENQMLRGTRDWASRGEQEWVHREARRSGEGGFVDVELEGEFGEERAERRRPGRGDREKWKQEGKRGRK